MGLGHLRVIFRETPPAYLDVTGQKPGERESAPTEQPSIPDLAPSWHTSDRSTWLEKQVETEGGEALIVDREEAQMPQWFAIWTHSHAEQLVHDQLAAKGFQTYLPMAPTWSRRAGVRRLIALPVFPGYLFVRHAIDKRSYIEILKARGVVKVLGERWDRLAPIPDAEIAGLQQVLGSDLAVLPHPHLREGQRVRIEAGPLAGVEGIFVRSKPQRGLLVLSVELLCQSIAVEIDCTVVTPIESPVPVWPRPAAAALPCA